MTNLSEEIEVLQKKFDAASGFIKERCQEREKLVARIDEIDSECQEADGDQRRLNTAINALRDDGQAAPHAPLTAPVEAKQGGMYPMGNLGALRK